MIVPHKSFGWHLDCLPQNEANTNPYVNSPFSITHREKSIENQVSKRLFAHHRRSLSVSVLEQQGSHIGIRAEARTLIAQRIRYKHIAVLAAQLALGVIEKVLRLHRKAAQQLSRLFVLAERGEDIRIAGCLLYTSPSPRD